MKIELSFVPLEAPKNTLVCTCFYPERNKHFLQSPVVSQGEVFKGRGQKSVMRGKASVGVVLYQSSLYTNFLLV
jgi:hypothetical protein